MFIFSIQATMELANQHSDKPDALKIIFSSLCLICKIFYSLNYQVRYFEYKVGILLPNFVTKVKNVQHVPVLIWPRRHNWELY